MKKGIIEVQFNWIFVLIAGVVIMLFFVNLVYKQADISRGQACSEVLNQLKPILTASESTERTVNEFNLGGQIISVAPYEFQCGSNSQGLGKRSLFSIKELDKEVITYSLSWNIPFKVINFLYVSSLNYEYYFVDQPVLDEIPPEFLMYSSSLEDIPFNNRNGVRLIYFDGDMDSSLVGPITKYNDEKITALNIKSEEPYNYGVVEFYNVINDNFIKSGESYFYGRPMLIGAIVTNDIEIYDQMSKNSFEKASLISDIYLERTQDLVDSSSNVNCRALYNSLVTDFRTVKDSVNSLNNPSNFQYNNFQVFYEAHQNIYTVNKEKIERSCASVI